MTNEMKSTLYRLVRDLWAPDWATRAEAITDAARLLSRCTDGEAFHWLRGVVAAGAEDDCTEVRQLASAFAIARGGTVRPGGVVSFECRSGRCRR